MPPSKKPLPLQQPPTPEQVEEDESSSSEEEVEEEEEEELSSDSDVEESDVEEKEEKPTAPQKQASKVTKKQPSIVEKQIIPPPPSVPQNHAQATKPKIVERESTPPPPAQPLPDSEEGSQSEEDEGFPSSPSVSDFTIKVNSPKKPTSKDTKPTLKRPSEPTKSDEKDLRSKKKAKAGEVDLKKEKPSATGFVGRVWSEEDEIRILDGMIDYQKQKGTDPSADMGAFHNFVKGNLQAESTKTQLYEKVRRLRNKYFKNAERIEKGENVDFSKPHETQTFGLSKKIWGGGGMTSNGVDENEIVNGNSDDGKLKKNSDHGKLKPNSKVVSLPTSPEKQRKFEKKNVVLKGEVKDDDFDGDGGDVGDFEKKYPFTVKAYTSLGLGGLMTADEVSFLKANLSVVGSATSEEFEEKWKELQVEETEILLKKFQLFADHTRRVLDGIKK